MLEIIKKEVAEYYGHAEIPTYRNGAINLEQDMYRYIAFVYFGIPAVDLKYNGKNVHFKQRIEKKMHIHEACIDIIVTNIRTHKIKPIEKKKETDPYDLLTDTEKYILEKGVFVNSLSEANTTYCFLLGDEYTIIDGKCLQFPAIGEVFKYRINYKVENCANS